MFVLLLIPVVIFCFVFAVIGAVMSRADKGVVTEKIHADGWYKVCALNRQIKGTYLKAISHIPFLYLILGPHVFFEFHSLFEEESVFFTLFAVLLVGFGTGHIVF